jgi:hypothetical protein
LIPRFYTISADNYGAFLGFAWLGFACVESIIQTEQDAEGKARPSQDRGKNAVMPVLLHCDGAMVADDVCDLADDGGFTDRGIAAGNGVSASDEVAGQDAQDAVGDEVSICAEEDDVAWPEVCEVTSADRHQVAGPHCWEHA